MSPKCQIWWNLKPKGLRNAITLSIRNMKKTTCTRHFIIKMLKTSEKEKILKTSRGKKEMYRQQISSQKQYKWENSRTVKTKIKTCQSRILYQENMLQKRRRSRTFHIYKNWKNFSDIKKQTWATRNIKGNPSNRRKTIADGNLDLHKRMKSSENDNHVGK